MAIQLHLGCWKRFIPGFIHIDRCDFPHIDYQHDVATLPMFSDDSVDLIYLSHVLEYFDRLEAIDVLTEYKRVLKKGGMLRLAVPDFESLMEVYQKTNDLNKILGPLYGRMIIEEQDKKNQIIYHKTVYDFVSLRDLLELIGFIEIHRYDWRKTVHKDYDDHSQAYFPHMDKENGLLISLNIQALKA